MNRYSRQVLLKSIGEKGQRTLLESRVLIVGCGALGTVIVNNLARAGVGHLRIVDRDFVELENLQRQVLFDEDDVAKAMPKVMAAAEKLHKINSSIEIEPHLKDVNSRNIEDLIQGMDVVLDGTDNMETRFLINDACLKHRIPWVYGGAVSSCGMTMNIIPGKTPCLRCIIPDLPAPGSLDTCDTVGVLNAVTAVIGSIESNEAIKILLGDEGVSRDLLTIDLARNCFDRIAVTTRSDCPACQKGEFEYLNQKGEGDVIKLCGREMIQITPRQEMTVSLEDLKARLERVGEATFMGFLLKFKVDKCELIIYPDGRAFVKGAIDKEAARSLYAKYVGL